MHRILTLGRDSYKNWINQDLLDKIEEAKGLVIFTGGPDVDPEIYGEANVRSYIDKNRSLKEIEAYNHALENNIPMLGICYGSQFLTAMQQNGKVIQNVTNHAISGNHSITDGVQELEITSTHHQMMNPFHVPNHKLIAWSSVNRSSEYTTGLGDIKIPFEPEIVYYPDTNCLAIQGHPEFPNCPKKTKEYCEKLIKKYLL